MRQKKTYIWTSNLAAIDIQAHHLSIGVGIGHNKSEEANKKLEEAEDQ